MEEINNTSLTREEIEGRELLGIIRNNWRQRTVKLYRSDREDFLYMVGRAFDNSRCVITEEPIGLNERVACDYWKHGEKVLVRD